MEQNKPPQMKITPARIREDLKEIRYYYARKERIDKTFKSVSENAILEKVRKYNEAIASATIELFDLYGALYTKNVTQESFANAEGYTPQHIQRLSDKLVFFFQKKFNEGGN